MFTISYLLNHYISWRHYDALCNENMQRETYISTTNNSNDEWQPRESESERERKGMGKSKEKPFPFALVLLHVSYKQRDICIFVVLAEKKSPRRKSHSIAVDVLGGKEVVKQRARQNKQEKERQSEFACLENIVAKERVVCVYSEK